VDNNTVLTVMSNKIRLKGFSQKTLKAYIAVNLIHESGYMCLQIPIQREVLSLNEVAVNLPRMKMFRAKGKLQSSL